MGYIRRNFTYANVVSIIVISMAMTASAYAAVMYTGTNIKNGTLTGADVKNGTLGKADLSATTYTSLRGRTGATGPQGVSGGPGPVGDTGVQGDMGDKSYSLVRYANYYSPFLATSPNTPANPNGSAVDFDDPTYQFYTGANVSNPNFKTSGFAANSQPVAITQNEPVLLQLTGNNQNTTGTIQPTGAGLLSATATITVSHHNNAESGSAFTGGLPIHGRIRCVLRYANNGAPITAGSPRLGTWEWLSSSRNHRVSTMTITGSEKISANLAANYNVGLSCIDPDYTGSNQWRYIAGNISAHAVYVGP